MEVQCRFQKNDFLKQGETEGPNVTQSDKSTKPIIAHLCHRSSSQDWNRNVITILNAKGAFAKESDGRFCHIRSQVGFGKVISRAKNDPVEFDKTF